jgi:hypothetical protein
MQTVHIIQRKENWEVKGKLGSAGHGHILRRNCLLQQVIEGKIKGGIEVRGR